MAPVVALEQEVVSRGYSVDIPAGAGADGIVNAAYAQLGVAQDCTDLVQNSLSAIGLVASRLNGGPDLGTSVGAWAAYGYQVHDGAYAPGDILIWPGYPFHLRGQWDGNSTVAERMVAARRDDGAYRSVRTGAPAVAVVRVA